jgi:hypothetical protein
LFPPSRNTLSLAEEGQVSGEPEALGTDDVSTSALQPRNQLPPLLAKLTERRPERLDYIAVSFGLTQQLLKFWKTVGFVPVYVRQTEVGFLCRCWCYDRGVGMWCSGHDVALNFSTVGLRRSFTTSTHQRHNL